jgi:hypothetical protein
MTRHTDDVIGDTLAMVNVVRQAFGKEQISELPDAVPGNAADCLFYRALSDVGVTSVNGAGMAFENERIAHTVATLWGTHNNGEVVRTPSQFGQVIGKFDHHELPHYQDDRSHR